MPGVEMMGSSEDLQAFEQPPSRSHKTLTRRGEITSSIEVIQPVSPDQTDQNGRHATTPSLPLTPPGVGHEELVVDERTPQKTKTSLPDMPTSRVLTPRQPSKPPTPDVTPPRTNSNKRPYLNQSSCFSSSSRTDSFQTALENISLKEDTDIPVRTSQTATQAPKQSRQPSKPPTLNGQLPQTSNIKHSPPSFFQRHGETEGDAGFEFFDGHWAANPIDGSLTPLAGKQKSAQNHIQLVYDPTPQRDVLDVEHIDASLMREKSLQDSANSAHEVKADPSMEQLREKIGSSSLESLAGHSETDARPLSIISSTSTVEAMIIDSPKRAQPMLRHTEKNSSLRSARSPITIPECTTYGSIHESQHRLIHKAARISDQDVRSGTSEMSFSAKTSNNAIQSGIETINVVVIPERNSSLTSHPNSHASSQLGSHRSSRRPPISSTSHSDIPGQKKHTVPDSVSTRSREVDFRGCAKGPPVIPPRASSLSAPTSLNNSCATSLTSNSLRSRPTERPSILGRGSTLSASTSRNNSCATSLTSDSLQSHDLANDLETQKGRQNQPISLPRRQGLASPNSRALLEAPNMHAVFASPDDMATLRPPSLPFTQGSIPSSSPGPIEIQEATAVSLTTHNNHSLLLVDPRVEASPRRPLQALGTSCDLPQPPRTPDNPLQTATFNFDSPLENPRPPPKPPSARPLPPLPLHDAQDESKGRGRRRNSVRRTWSTQPGSDSFNAIARSLSMKSAKNRTAGMDIDSRLYPFWRPRPFWEGISGSPEKERSPTREDLARRDESLIVKNSLGMPHRRIIFDGPPALARRSPEMKRLLNEMTSNGSLVDHGIFRTGSPLNSTRFQSLSRWGLRRQSMPWRILRNRIRRVRLRRDERKRAIRRELLKRSIGGPVYVASSVTAEVAMR
ncbi:putative transporter MCH4 [Penicillium digitatum]|uniref:Uncharacterized protein n=3 Tax=Penicillium digitatum TaxID=36651 RepID=K9FIX0_PEND2|nr:hypothetical protein PDIP_71550 [Penicillium digitatum Pd1]EKV07875.1 hypothetical protein PDIP_71550 [Penicillium digitatum Pd1]EKV09445.1 hypothetical protein PDIG_62160 [Penicillium digitatum PHI26]KAG0159079.1 hypothetical protein PDIDSM_6599 [Penicillium digitatum]QQK41432.1 putative transporter MCH4 [Penicillium digitatum]